MKSRRMRGGWTRGIHKRGEKYVLGFGGKAWGKEPLERPRCRWEDGLKMDLREIGLGGGHGFTCLRIGTFGGLWWMWWWTFVFWHCEVSYCVVWSLSSWEWL
jgi:hypothetical protein